MKIIFLGYRDWAKNVIKKLKNNSGIKKSVTYSDEKKFLIDYSEGDFKGYVVIAIGWSWILKKEITTSNFCIGVHPSDLPNYRGGSPIQNQIIDGVIDTKLSLFQLTDKLDEGNIYGQCDLSLAGDSIKEIFKNLETQSIFLLNEFIKDYPNISPKNQMKMKIQTKKRRSPKDSKINFEEFNEDNLVNLYNKIRCLTDPYPNAFLEDNEGNKLFFQSVEFKKNNSK